jgi:hypothetical protein
VTCRGLYTFAPENTSFNCKQPRKTISKLTSCDFLHWFQKNVKGIVVKQVKLASFLCLVIQSGYKKKVKEKVLSEEN